jgi:P27 family predicted phage terminase small subunit
MKAGQRPKSVILKKLEGNPGKQKLPKNEPIPPAEMPNCPSTLDAYGLEKWNEVAPGLVAMGTLAKVDGDILTAYCSSWSRYRAAEEALADLRKSNPLNALILKTVSGNYIQQPLIGISNTAARDFVRYGDILGIGETSRARLGISRDKGNDSKFKGLVGIAGGKK